MQSASEVQRREGGQRCESASLRVSGASQDLGQFAPSNFPSIKTKINPGILGAGARCPRGVHLQVGSPLGHLSSDAAPRVEGPLLLPSASVGQTEELRTP